MDQGQPIHVDAALSIELNTVGDVRLLARLLDDLKIADIVPLDDAASICIALPIREWSMSHPSTLSLELEAK